MNWSFPSTVDPVQKRILGASEMSPWVRPLPPTLTTSFSIPRTHPIEEKNHLTHIVYIGLSSGQGQQFKDSPEDDN